MLTFKSAKKWLFNFFELQFFLSLVSLPILVYWGLPLSWLSPLSNLIFSPFLLIFLFISSLIFFFELLYIPNGFLIYLLEKVTSCWTFILELITDRWLFGFHVNPLFILLPLAALYIHCFAFKKNRRKTFLLASFLGLGFVIFGQFNVSEPIIEVPYHKSQMYLLHDKDKLNLVIPCLFSSVINNENFIEYTLLPLLYKKFGTSKLHSIVLLKLSPTTLNCTALIAKECHCAVIYLPYWHGTTPDQLRAYGTLRNSIKQQGGQLERIGKTPISISQNWIIHPGDTKLRYKDIEFYSNSIRGTLGKKEIEISPKNYRVDISSTR